MASTATPDSLGRPEGIAAWALVTAWLLVPIGIAVTLIPDLIASSVLILC